MSIPFQGSYNMETQLELDLKNLPKKKGPYIPESGSKPRYDGEGSEFGKIHRQLPKFCGLFDIDRMNATANLKLELKEEDSLFVEYATNFNDSTCNFKAVFDIKKAHTKFVKEALNFKMGTASWAQLQLCKKIGARFFIIIGTNGIQPFNFYEIEYNGTCVHKGELRYFDSKTDGIIAVEKFWRENLGLL